MHDTRIDITISPLNTINMMSYRGFSPAVFPESTKASFMLTFSPMAKTLRGFSSLKVTYDLLNQIMLKNVLS